MGRTGRRSQGPGPAPLQAQREEYAALRARGVNNAEACRIVGVNRRTGSRWLYGRNVPRPSGEDLHYPPVITTHAQPVRSERYLSAEEREVISDLRRAGATYRAIGHQLGRSASTIFREISRNSDPAGVYRPAVAQRLATGRVPRPRARRLGCDPVLREAVQSMLDTAWSPEQISHALQTRFRGDAARQLCHESIYQAIYDRNSDLASNRCAALRTRRRRRRPRKRDDARTPRSLRDMTPIHQRPAAVEDRVEPGHWEGDLILGTANRSAIGTLVERTSRYTILVHLPDSHGAVDTCGAVIAAMLQVPPHLRCTLTWDQGKEMAHHLQITTATGTDVYFCDAHSPWQRPTNENTNGLLRQYFPKGTNLRVHSAEDLAAVQAELNDRPRKILGWRSPADVLAGLQSPVHEATVATFG